MSGVTEIEVPGCDDAAYLVSPDSPNGAAILFLHWFDEAPNANRTQFLDEAQGLASLGVTSLLPQLSFPWKSPPTDADSDMARIDGELSTLLEATHILESAAAVEGQTRLGVVGHDFGAMHGVLLLARHPAACAVLIAPTPRWSDWFLPFWKIEGNRYDYMRSLGDLDPINTIASVDCPLLFQFGKQDFYIAPMTGLELLHAANEPKRLESYDLGHEMAGDAVSSDRLEFLTQHLGLGQ